VSLTNRTEAANAARTLRRRHDNLTLDGCVSEQRSISVTEQRTSRTTGLNGEPLAKMARPLLQS